MDVDQLLKKHTLAELKEVEKKLRTDVERKKEDLRHLVASRYRELIDAADKIKHMHVTVTSVTAQLDSFSPKSRDPSAPQELVHRTLAKVPDDREDPDILDRVVTRLLHVAPEIIFRSLDSDDPLRAALFFAFIKNLVWQWNVGRSSLSQSPQWIFLRSHEGFILNAVGSLFEKITFQPLELSRCACSALIISSAATKTSVLSDFLSRRSLVVRGLLTDSESSLSVREALELALLSILSTLRGVHEVFYAQSLFGFVENESASVRTWILRDVFVADDITSVPEVLNSYDGILNILNFEDPNFVQNSFVRDRVSKWVSDVIAEIAALLEKQLGFVPSIQAVLNIRKALDVVVLEENRKSPSAKILARDLNVSLGDVVGCFDGATKRRYAGLVSERLYEVLQNVEVRLAESAETANSLEKENDFICSVASVEAGRNVVSARPRFPGRPRHVVPQGRPPDNPSEQSSVVSIVTTSLSALWSEMHPTTQPNISDSPWIMDELATAYTSFFRNLSEIVLRVVASASSDTYRLSLTASHRFLRSLRSTENHLIHKDVPDSSRDVLIEVIHREVDSCASIVFQKWLESVTERWKKETISKLKQSFDPVVWSLKSSPFQKVTVEEANESGERVSYALLVPAKASSSFHGSLKSLHDELVEFSSGHVRTLINDSAVNRCFSALLTCYEESLQTTPNLTKSQALQLIFDVNMALAFARARKGFPMASVRGFQGIIERLSGFVDPIDYNVLLPYLDRNVEIYAESVRNLFFSLTALDSGSGRVGGGETARVPQSSVIQFKPVWFSQLPVPNAPAKTVVKL